MEKLLPQATALDKYAGDPMPHLLVYLKGELKAVIAVRPMRAREGERAHTPTPRLHGTDWLTDARRTWSRDPMRPS